ncbi:MAG: uroporphyrinogen decarboxylase family protein [Planctomycetota bacterium]|jgi:uroporphyrinogen decarboxylase
MKFKNLPVVREPDFRRLEAAFRRRGQPGHVPFFELAIQVWDDIARLIDLPAVPGPAGDDPVEQEKYAWRREIAWNAALGYDYVRAGRPAFGFPQTGVRGKGMTPQGERSYILGSTCTIRDRRDFERYQWPDAAAVDYSPLDRIGRLLPKGMKVVAGCSGVLENVMWLLGYEGISYLLHDDKDLVRDMFDAVGSRVVEFLGRCASFESAGAVFLNDDVGFNTQTLLSPQVYRRYLFPWHRRVVEAIHAHGKPACIHACGFRLEIMEDIIACGWDGIHAFQDAVEPVWEAKRRWGDRIAVIGGFDMDRISRSSLDQVRAHTRFLIEECAAGGGWALGTGNTVANYVPAENFLAMLDEALSI